MTRRTRGRAAAADPAVPDDYFLFRAQRDRDDPAIEGALCSGVAPACRLRRLLHATGWQIADPIVWMRR